MKLSTLPPKAKKAEVVAPLTINVATNPQTGGRIVSFEMPQFKKYTDAERQEIESEKGKSAEAQCDITGELIFDPKNVFELRTKDADRKDVDGITLSYKVIKQLLIATNPVIGPKLKK